MRFRVEVRPASIGSSCWFNVNTHSPKSPDELLKLILKDWSYITGLNWSAMPFECFSDHAVVEPPLANQAPRIFLWEAQP